MLKIFILSVLALCLISVALSLDSIPEKDRLSNLDQGKTDGVAIPRYNNEWDYILYTTRWPAAVAENNTVPPNVTGFTIHGMWPNRNDTTWPEYCTNQKFDIKQIETLVPVLDEIWHDFEHPENPSDFWSHEYDKHGTCASSDSLLTTQFEFFSTAIKLHQGVFTLEKALSKAGIVPSATKMYSLTSFQKAIQTGVGAFPLMTCSQNSNGNVQVDRIQFCVSKSLELYTCNQAITTKIAQSGNCGTGTISFPVIPRE